MRRSISQCENVLMVNVLGGSLDVVKITYIDSTDDELLESARNRLGGVLV